MSDSLFDTILQRKKPFIYLHTHAITPRVLDDAIKSSASIEIDVSIDNEGNPFIGHPLSFYEYKKLAPPANLPIDDVIARLQKTNLYVVMDCKDVRAIPWVKQTTNVIGRDRSIFHAWSDSLLFKPYDTNAAIEPHWIHEDLPQSVIQKLYEDTHIPILLSARGLTHDYINDNYQNVLQRILAATRPACAAIHFNLPGGQAPSMEIMNELLAHGILTLLNIDIVPPGKRPEVFVGMTDHINAAGTVRF